MKKISALLMAAVMLLSVCSFAALADEAPIRISIYYSDNEQDLKDKGIEEFVDLYNQYNKYK